MSPMLLTLHILPLKLNSRCFFCAITVSTAASRCMKQLVMLHVWCNSSPFCMNSQSAAVALGL